jgi:hypothetical protein
MSDVSNQILPQSPILFTKNQKNVKTITNLLTSDSLKVLYFINVNKMNNRDQVFFIDSDSPSKSYTSHSQRQE